MDGDAVELFSPILLFATEQSFLLKTYFMILDIPEKKRGW